MPLDCSILLSLEVTVIFQFSNILGFLYMRCYSKACLEIRQMALEIKGTAYRYFGMILQNVIFSLVFE